VPLTDAGSKTIQYQDCGYFGFQCGFVEQGFTKSEAARFRQKARNELASPTHAVSSLPQSIISNGAKPSNSIATHGFQQVIRRRRGR
jgi:hypothetical protein